MECKDLGKIKRCLVDRTICEKAIEALNRFAKAADFGKYIEENSLLDISNNVESTGYFIGQYINAINKTIGENIEGENLCG